MWNFRPILLFIFFLGFSCSFTKEESILYQLSLYDLDGRPVSLKEYKGKVLLLDVWASWCEPCKDAVPVLEKLSKDLQGKTVFFWESTLSRSFLKKNI
ncbi:glutathione peroxidase domain protein, partial [Leptospira borgpetersenii serovar Pomona str. 200901868]